MSISKDFKYATAAESERPNYLKTRFDKIRRELREQAERERVQSEAVSVEAAIKVRMLKGTK